MMVPYVVRQGDFLAKLALRFAFDAATVWNDPKNASLKEARPNPDILCPGDVLYIPQTKKTWQPITVGAVNKFCAEIPQITVNLKLVFEGAPLANKACRVEGAGDPFDLTTGGDGSLTFSLPLICEGVFVVLEDPPGRYEVRPGWMDPEEVPSGIRLRLANLGYLDDVGVEDDSVADSLSAFQTDSGLESTGMLDDATQQKLIDSHGH